MRVVVGTAVYTSNFTPSIAPLAAVSGTWLLTCQSNRFVDNSSNAYALTSTGTSVQAFSPFNPTSAWSASSNGGSGYFDGSGDYLTGPANSTPLSFGTGDFTIESWVYPTSFTNANSTIFAAYGSTTGAYILYLPSSGYPNFYVYLSGGLNGNVFSNPSSKLALNAWSHVAVTRSSGVFRLFINGVVIDSFTNTTANINATTSNNSSVGAYFQAGMSLETTSPITGYLADVRVVKGTAVYTAAFTPPTAPLTAITNTSLLLNYTNAGIYDNAAVGNYETVGNAQVSTSVVKYGTGSMAFQNQSTYVKNVPPTKLTLGDNFTIEGWVYITAAATTSNNYTDVWQLTFGSKYILLEKWRSGISNNLFARYYDGTTTSDITATYNSNFTADSWFHVAYVKLGTTATFYLNGLKLGTSTISATDSLSQYVIGGGSDNTTPTTPQWYVDDFRITKYARYPYNFTPPTAAFPNIGGTVTPTSDQYFNYTTLLLPGNGTNGAQNNTFLDSSSNAFTITRNGNTTQGNFSPFSQTGWGNYFDGATATRLTLPSNAAFAFGTGAYTVEAWVYLTAYGTQTTIFDAGSASGAFDFAVTSSGALSIGAYGVGAVLSSSASAVPLNQWVYVAAVRTSTSANGTALFVNGTSVTTGTDASNWTVTTTPNIGGYNLAGYTLTGYISNLRVTKGGALYTANFTPSTTPLTTTVSAGTVSLLTCQSNRFLDNSANAFAITVNGSPSVQAFSPFAPTAAWTASTNGGSGYFDGSGDYLDIASTAALTPSGDFTIEFWAYPTTNAGIREWYSKGLGIQVYSNGAAWYAALSTSNSGTYYINTTFGTLLANTWQHVVVTRSGNSYVGFVNGVSSSLATTSSSPSTGTDPVRIGDLSVSAVYPVLGYMSGVRYVNGTAVYGTSNFTPPTSPLTAIANTQLLLNFTNGGITDATAKNNLETVGNAQISTTQSKFGGSSMAFDGTGDYLNIPNSPLLQLGGGDWTIECWVYLASTSGTQRVISQSDSNYQFAFYLSSGALTAYSFQSSGTQNFAISMGTLSASTWYHIAVTRYGNSVKAFVNGIQAGSTATLSTTIDARTGGWKLGAAYNGSENLNGYVQGARITLGIARYTSNFTPPTSAFLLQ